MKILFRGFAVFIMTAILFVTGCGGGGTNDNIKKSNKIRIVTTIFPLYDWTRVLVGDNNERVEITFLLSSGVDMHSYQPTSKDFLTLSHADICVFVGGESDKWLKEALAETQNDKMIKLNLLEVLGERAKTEERTEGMSEGGADEPKEDAAEQDEHIWLSPQNAATLCAAIGDALKRLDGENAAKYDANLRDYQAKLATLDEQYRQTVAQAKTKTLIFADRFPFRYLTDDYGLKYYAAFPGCSAETEASFQTVAFLSNKVKELKPAAILTVEGRTHQVAETVAQNAGLPGLKILTLDSMQATTGQDAQKGASYLAVMENNLTVLKEALGE